MKSWPFAMKALLALLVVALGLFVAAYWAAPKLYRQESFVFGTRVEVQVWARNAQRANQAMAAVLREFDRLHHDYHAWEPSILTDLNASIADGVPFEASPELAGYVKQAREFSAMSERLFDPGIGALVELWGFYGDVFLAQLPDPDALAALIRSKPSILDLHVEDNRILSANRTVALDFGGFLKGVALDNAVAILRGRGIHNALINIGGNVMALGSKGGTPWRVGIQHPRKTTPIATLDLKDGEAIGTSGDYQRYFILDEQRYCHLIDPRTGRPSAAAQAVTVLIPPQAEAGTWSDWASKPLFIAGDEWRGMAQKLKLTQVLRVGATGQVEMTDAMKARLTMEAAEPAGAKPAAP